MVNRFFFFFDIISTISSLFRHHLDIYKSTVTRVRWDDTARLPNAANTDWGAGLVQHKGPVPQGALRILFQGLPRL